MILWVSMLIWAELGSFLISSLVSSCSFRHLVALLGSMVSNGCVYNCQNDSGYQLQSFVLLCKTATPRARPSFLFAFLFILHGFSHRNCSTQWKYEPPQFFLKLRFYNLSNKTYSISCSKQIKTQIQI